MLQRCFQQNQYFELSEGLQLAGKFINIDETGRNKLYNTLREMLAAPSKYTVPVPNELLEYESDVCSSVNDDQIQRLRLLTPFYQDRVLHDTDDLVTPIIKVLKAIRPEHFSNDLQELMSDIRPDSPENNLIRERELMAANIERVKADHKDRELLKGLENKRAQLDYKITILKERVISMLRALLESSNTVTEVLFRSVVGWVTDRPRRTLLEGLFGLSSLERAQAVFRNAWECLSEK